MKLNFKCIHHYITQWMKMSSLTPELAVKYTMQGARKVVEQRKAPRRRRRGVKSEFGDQSSRFFLKQTAPARVESRSAAAVEGRTEEQPFKALLSSTVVS